MHCTRQRSKTQALSSIPCISKRTRLAKKKDSLSQNHDASPKETKGKRKPKPLASKILSPDDNKVDSTPTKKPNNLDSCKLLGNLSSAPSISKSTRLANKREQSKAQNHDASPNYTERNKKPKLLASKIVIPDVNKVNSTATKKPINPDSSKLLGNLSSTPSISKSTRLANKREKLSQNYDASPKNTQRKLKPQLKAVSPQVKEIDSTATKKPFNLNSSFKILENRCSSKTLSGNVDVYEFTYDPKEEPPKKKKRKRAVRKKPTKPKTIIINNNYDENILKSLASLKNVVNKTLTPTQALQNINTISVAKPEANKGTPKSHSPNNVSIPLENIVVEPASDHHDYDYSPVISPTHLNAAHEPPSHIENNDKIPQFPNNDPLNLQEEFSFFDEVPIASSSMNMSTRCPTASPWRVQFQDLPIKWQANTYVKANMTPAVESSFTNYDDNKKKHVYTNIDIGHQDTTSDTRPKDNPVMKQQSIISYIKEVLDRSAQKKKRERSVTPTRIVTDDLSKKQNTNDSVFRSLFTPKKDVNNKILTPNKNTPLRVSSSEEKNKENTRESQKQKCSTPVRTPLKDKSKNHTLFGFDISDTPDKENIENIDKKRVQALRPRARAVLQEFNQQKGPTRALIPVSKSQLKSNSELVDKFYNGFKSAAIAPVLPEQNAEKYNETTNVTDPTWHENEDSENSQSIHLFEDIELVHHLKPTRKSYGKPKKVTFQQSVSSDSDTQITDVGQHDTSDQDEPFDLTYEMPSIKPKRIIKKKTIKKQTKKQKLSKKEEQEAEAWAAGFNSMCEDIDGYDLVVE